MVSKLLRTTTFRIRPGAKSTTRHAANLLSPVSHRFRGITDCHQAHFSKSSNTSSKTASASSPSPMTRLTQLSPSMLTAAKSYPTANPPWAAIFAAYTSGAVRRTFLLVSSTSRSARSVVSTNCGDRSCAQSRTRDGSLYSPTPL